MKLFPHQEKFVKGYNGPRILAHEAGTGKTICACLWLKDDRDADALVVCPKQIKKKWEEELKKWGTKAKVLSKEEFKKQEYKSWSAIILDEADCFASPLFTKGRSQLTEKMYNLIRIFKPQVLLLSATPIRSNPWNLHTLMTFAGKYIDWKKWRDHFFKLKRLPYLPRPAWMPRSNWRALVRPLLEKNTDIVSLKDCVGYLPPVTEHKVKVKCDEFDPQDWEPTKAFFEEHRHEQKHKVPEILEIAKGYRKVLVVAYYVEQIEELGKTLSRDRETFIIHGGVKNHEAIIKEAQESDECFIVVQASIGAGFDLDTFSCAVFASMSYSVRDMVQMKARIRRIKNLHPVSYYYLLAGRCDEAIYNNIEKGKSFVPAEWVV